MISFSFTFRGAPLRLSEAFIVFSLVMLLIGSPHVLSQANVIENQTTIVYVDGNAGSDSNLGTISAPLKTIQAAVNKANANNQKEIGTKIIVNAGVYRETVSIYPVSNQSTVPLTIQGAATGTAIIAGSDVLSNWSPDPVNASAYVTSWTPQKGICTLPSGWPINFAPIALHTEMIFVNGVPLTQVTAYAQLKQGTFFIDETEHSLHIWPSAGTNMQTAAVEAATRPKTISVVGRSNIVLRGLVFRHAASCINASGATVTTSSNVLIDSVQALWNNWGGLGVFASSNYTIQNSIASYNGGIGIQGDEDQNALYRFDESDYNNWRGAQAAFYEWGMGGTKLFEMRGTTVQKHFAYNNQAEGLWFDTDNKNISIDGATLVGNLTAALQIERDEGPITFENSLACSNGVGVNLLTSEQVTIANNTLYNNGGTNKYQAQIYLAGQAGGKVIADFLTGEKYDLFTTGLVLTGNTFVDAAAGQNVFGTYVSGADWTDFTTTLNAGKNLWYDPNIANSFKIENAKLVNLAGWQAVTGTDYTSTWAAPVVSPVMACAVPTPSFADFNVNVDSGNYTMSAGKVVSTINVNSFGFGAVNLSLTGLPSGVSASISRESLISGVTTLTLSASTSALNQTVPLTLWAISGSRVHSVTFNVHVIPL
jgi:Right handed beta helix region